MQLVIAENPSVARDLARVWGVRPAGKNCFPAKDRVITWCVGHLVELDEPGAQGFRWGYFRSENPIHVALSHLRACPDGPAEGAFAA